MRPEWAAKLTGDLFLAGITKTELAAELGLSRTYVSSVLSGIKAPPGAEARFRGAYQELLSKKKSTR